MENGIYNVPEENLGVLKARIEKLNKRAAKLQVAPVVLNELGYEDVDRQDDYGKMLKLKRRVYQITLQGEAPRVNGWKFIGTLQSVAEENNGVVNILRAVPDEKIPEQYRNASASNCDHCHKNIRRNDTFILRSDEGSEYKQVGRNCLQDFLRTENGSGYASAAEFLFSAADLCGEAEEEGWGGSRAAARYELEDFLARTSVAIRINGWLSRKSAREFSKNATADWVLGWIYNRDHSSKSPYIDWEVTEYDKERAASTLEWLRGLTPDQSEDYLYNLSVIGKLETIDDRMVGLTASAIPAYLRVVEKEVERNKRIEDGKNSEFFGTIGKREVFTLTVEFYREFESDYGCRTLYKFRDENGNIATWWASGSHSKTEWNMGDVVKVKATVKNHEVYKEAKQTMLQRVTELAILAKSPAAQEAVQ